jgi:predicted phage terminase large subunit-like protein
LELKTALRTSIYPFPKHLSYLNERLKRIPYERGKRILITFPPRHGKSETTSAALPAYVLLLRNKWRVMLASYEAEFAAEWGRKARDIISEAGPWYGIKVREDVAARNSWEITKWNPGIHRYLPTGGGMKTAGVLGPLTGRGADLAIIDDPIKNAEEAFSPVYRQKTWDWFVSTMYTRLEPGASVIMILTRWHEDDIAGRIIAQMIAGGEQWELINIPAIAEEGDLLGREVGEALWPDRYDIETLRTTEATIGSYWFSALYQQRPIPVGKGIFSQGHLRRYEETTDSYLLVQPDGTKIITPKAMCRVFSTMDLAVSTKTTADYTVLSTWAVDRLNNLMLINSRKIRLEGPDQLPLMQQVYNQYHPVSMHVEKVAYQLALIQSALRAGLPVLPITPDKDKISRALAAAARMQMGTIYFPVYADYLLGEEGFETELWRFPAAAHDDQVDTLSYAVEVVANPGYTGNLG